MTLKYLVRPGTMWIHAQAHRAQEAVQTQVMIIPTCPGRVRNELFGNFPHVHVRKDPKSRTQHNNMKKNQGTNITEKEVDTDSTATETTAACTSVCGLEWDNYTTEGLSETTTLNNQI